jgi:ankyrin repeat protein
MHLGAQLKSAPVAEDIAFSTIGNGGNPNLATHSGDTVLHTAARAGHERVVKLCLQRSSNPDARNSQGEAPIDLVRKSGSRAAVALLEDQATITRAHAEQRFAYTRGLKKASWVQPDGIPQEMTNHTVLFCHFGFDEVKKMISLCPALLNSKASWDELPVEAAAHMGREDIASYLLDREALYSICTATMFGDLATVKTLLQTDKDSLWERGAHHYPVLWYTAFGNERVEIASYLIDRGADLRDDIRGRTVLHVAAASGHIDRCRLLLELGADPNQNGMTMKGERTPIQIAVEEKHPETASLLRTWYSQ